jgi:hypothetical protein
MKNQTQGGTKMKKMEKMMNEAAKMLENEHKEITYGNLVSCLYAAKKVKEAGASSYKEMLNATDDDLRLAVNRDVSEKSFDVLKKFAENHTEAEFDQALLCCRENRFDTSRMTAPGESLISFLEQVLNASAAQSVLSFGFLDQSDFLAQVLSNTGSTNVRASVQYAPYREYSKMRMEQFGNRVSWFTEDLFENQTEKADKVFCFPLFGKNTVELAQERESAYLSDLGMEKPAASAYAYAVLASHLIAENGKAAVLLHPSDLTSTRPGEKECREWLIDNGMLESVVLLPNGLMHGTNVDTALLILSHGNKQVRFVDAKEAGLYRKERRETEMDPSQIEKVMELLNSKESSSFARTISNNEISSHEYSLDFHQYLAESLMVKDGVKFKSVMKDISRGAQMVSKKMKALETEEHTRCRYLAISDVENGMIRSDLSCLKEIPEKMEKYCVQDGDLLISRSYPFKTAVAKVEEDEQILLSGNFYRIEVDSSKANPYFIKAFLESGRGSEILEMLGKGTAIPMISASDLKEIMLPLPEMETQNRVAESYFAAQQDVIACRGRYEQALEKLAETYDREMSEE